jgi:hypothetical protein
MFQGLCRILADHNIQNDKLRDAMYAEIPEEVLHSIIAECDELIRPHEDYCYDYFGNRFSYIRAFSPPLLENLDFRSNKENDPLLLALDTIKQMNVENKRKVPENAVIDFIPGSWDPYLRDEKGKIVRKYYELSSLWELRSGLRSGDIWIDNSRRYADPESYLISKAQWPSLRSETCRLLGLPENGEERLKKRGKKLSSVLNILNQEVCKEDSSVRIEDNKIILTPYKADDLPESCKQLKKLISQRLPRVELVDLLIEVDSWTNFTDCFENAGGNQPRTKGLLTHIYASILAQACNFGLVKMAELSDLTYTQLAWCTNWYIRDETLQDGINSLVNYQYSRHQSALGWWHNVIV